MNKDIPRAEGHAQRVSWVDSLNTDRGVQPLASPTASVCLKARLRIIWTKVAQWPSFRSYERNPGYEKCVVRNFEIKSRLSETWPGHLNPDLMLFEPKWC